MVVSEPDSRCAEGESGSETKFVAHLLSGAEEVYTHTRV